MQSTEVKNLYFYLMPKFKPVILIGSIGMLLISGCDQPANKEIVKEITVEKDAHFSMPEIPNSMTFCDQEIDLTTFGAKERLDKELLVNTFMCRLP